MYTRLLDEAVWCHFVYPEQRGEGSDFVMEDGDNLFVRDAEVTHGDGGV